MDGTGMTTRIFPVLPGALLAWHTRAAKLAKPLLERLPMQPPSLLLALALNRVLLPRLPGDAKAALSGRAVEVAVTDMGLTLRLRLQHGGFAAAGADEPVALRIAAALPTFVRLARGDDDADRLFFERALVMEGDTEFGLVLKNTLDAIGPLVAP
jgi:predicted lipid carrier protein YhbT